MKYITLEEPDIANIIEFLINKLKSKESCMGLCVGFGPKYPESALVLLNNGLYMVKNLERKKSIKKFILINIGYMKKLLERLLEI